MYNCAVTQATEAALWNKLRVLVSLHPFPLEFPRAGDVRGTGQQEPGELGGAGRQGLESEASLCPPRRAGKAVGPPETSPCCCHLQARCCILP